MAVERLRQEVAVVTDWRGQLRQHQKQVLIGAAVAGFVLGGGIAGVGRLLRRPAPLARAWLGLYAAQTRVRTGADQYPDHRSRVLHAGCPRRAALRAVPGPVRGGPGVHRDLPVVALGPAVDRIKRLKLPRAASILAVFLGMFSAIFLIGMIVVPPIVNEVEAFAGDVPSYIDDIRSNKTLREYDDKYKITKKLEEQAKNLPSKLGQAAGALQAVTVGVFSTVIQLVTVLTITFFLLLDGGRIVNFILAQVRPEHQDRVRQVRLTSTPRPGAMWRGRSRSPPRRASDLHRPQHPRRAVRVPLAVLMAFFDLIPLVGSTIGGVLVGVVTVFGDFPGDTIIWVIYVVAYQQVENSVFQPFVYRRAVNLHPLAVITAILVGSKLLGVLGALVAIPIAAAIQIALKDLWHNRSTGIVGTSGDPIPAHGGDEPPRKVELPPGAAADASA
jgi:predicted PurR-regulated permease PerM